LKRQRLYNNQSGEEEDIQVDGAFIFIGLVPNTQLLQGS
jgi:alkyl hydroperoxide reductase subunit AhpF